MKIALLFLFVLAVGAALMFKGVWHRPLQRGMAQQEGWPPVLTSSAKPGAALEVATGARLVSRGWCDLAPDSRHSVPAGVKMWYGLYTLDKENRAARENRADTAEKENSEDKGRVISAILEAADPWQWSLGHNMPFRLLRKEAVPFKGETLFESFFLLAAKDDPFACLPPDATDLCLSYRAALFCNFKKTQLVVEYHEVLDAQTAASIEYELPLLNAFAQRARGSYRILLRDAQGRGDVLPGPITALDKAPATLSRRVLARWAGDMRRSDDL